MEDQGSSSRWIPAAPWAVLLVVGLIAVLPLLPPTAVGAGAAPTEFSAVRAFTHIEAVAREPHPIGTVENVRVRGEIAARLEALGLEPELQTIDAPDYFGVPGRTVEVVNVMARIPGTAPTGAVAVMGHYDSAPITPGANDNASAVAVILETARALLADGPLRNDVILLFTDGEEPAPRFGSTPFVAEHPWSGDIGFVINLEAIGSGGPSLLLETNGSGGWIIDRYAAAVPHPAAFSFLTATVEMIGGSNTDFAPFRDAGIPGMEMAYAGGSPIYHTAADAPDRVSLGSLQQHGANTLAMARHIGALDLDDAGGDDDAVFFTVGRWWVVRHPAGWSLPLVLVAGAMLAVAVGHRRVWRQAARGAGFTLLWALGAAVAAMILWMVVAGLRDTMGVVESYGYLAGLVAVTVGAGVAVQRRTGRGPDMLGVVAAWWAMALLVTLPAPGIGYLFLWPALFGAAVLVWWSVGEPGLPGRMAGAVVVAGITLVLLVPAIDVYYQFAQPRPGNPDSELLWMVALPVLLAALVVDLVRAFTAEPEPPATLVGPAASGAASGPA